MAISQPVYARHMEGVQPGPTYEVVAVRYGLACSTKSDLYYRYSAYGEPDDPQNMDFFFYVLRDGPRTVLVDTGFDLGEAERRAGRETLVPPAEALRLLEVDPATVEQVIVTHLHWDHIGNLDLFPSAELIVPEAELEFWSDPIARQGQFWPHTDPAAIEAVMRARADGRVRASGADEVLIPGVRGIVVGGHSAGQEILVVEGTGGTVVLASDATHLYEELELSRPFAVAVNFREMYEAYELLRGFESDGAVVVPGHDPLVFERFERLGGEIDFAVRIA